MDIIQVNKGAMGHNSSQAFIPIPVFNRENLGNVASFKMSTLSLGASNPSVALQCLKPNQTPTGIPL